jgi:hypothetical protein
LREVVAMAAYPFTVKNLSHWVVQMVVMAVAVAMSFSSSIQVRQPF